MSTLVASCARFREAFRKSTWSERTFLFVLTGSHLYYFHRWAFRYSDSGTSPTYEQTPLSWQAIKYPLILGAGLVVLMTGLNRFGLKANQAGLFSGLLALYTIFGFLQVARGFETVDDLALLRTWFFFPLVIAIPFFFRGRDSVEIYLAVGALIVSYHAIFTGWQLLYYVAFDRLPALAYAGSIVRFGGGLDDPNSFGVFLILPLLILLARRPSGGTAATVRGVSILMITSLLALTISFSALAAVLVGVSVFAWCARRPRYIVTMLLVLVVALGIASMSATATEFLRVKQNSAAVHFALGSGYSSLGSFLADASFNQWFFGDPGRGYRNENSYLQTLMNYGIAGLLPLLAAIVLTVSRAIRRIGSAADAGSRHDADFLAALLGYVAAFAVAGLGTPQFDIFPTNLIFWIVAMVIWLPFEPSPIRPVDRRPRSGRGGETPCARTRPAFTIHGT